MTDDDDNTPTAFNTVEVGHPAAWCWWSPRSMQPVNPDVKDRRSARRIMSAKADWANIVAAVRYAISKLPTDAHTIHADTIQVELPMPLTKTELALVSAWVGPHRPVIYDYEDDLVGDGRHRIWLAGTVDNDLIPVVAGCLQYLRHALTGTLPSRILIDALDQVQEWWASEFAYSPMSLTDVNTDVHHANTTHRRNLALAYLHLTIPGALPARWFKHLHSWDDAMPVLAGLHTAGRTSQDLLRASLPTAWQRKQDRHRVPADTVLSMFHLLAGPNGFTINGHQAPRPRGKLRLYRGSTVENRFGPSWTVNPSIAEHFARFRQNPGTTGHIWSTLVPAEKTLAYLPHEDEYIVDLTNAAHLVEPYQPGTHHRLTRWQTSRLRRWSQTDRHQ